MELLLTYYVSAEPTTVRDRLDDAVRRGIEATADLATNAKPSAASTENESFGIRVHGGNTGLDGSEVRISGTTSLTTVQVAVPWTADDAATTKLQAASRFAATVADEVLVAA